MVHYPRSDQEKARLYLHCMLEVKQRIAAIVDIINSDAIALFKSETAHLHLRHICELIAIGCLAAQGDYKTERAFTREYSPGKIFAALRRRYPMFFPQPSELTQRKLPDGRTEHHLQGNSKMGAYGESDITDLWSHAGNVLHRASVRKYLSQHMTSPAPSFEPIKEHLDGLMLLLQEHVIVIRRAPPKVVMLYVAMENGEGGATANFLHADEETGELYFEGYSSSLVSPAALG